MKKRLRLRLRTLLLVVAIVAMGLFWVRWPMMTASSFVASPEIGSEHVIVDFDTLDEQMDRIEHFASYERKSIDLVPFDRSLRDVLFGVQHFDYGMYDITARRGAIGLYGPYYDFGFGKLRR